MLFPEDRADPEYLAASKKRHFRFIFITGVLLTVGISTVLYLHRQSEVQRLISFEERQNAILAQMLAQSFRLNNASVRLSDTYRGIESDVHSPAFREISASILDLSAGLPVMKIKIYNPEGITIYSTVSAEVGKDGSDNLGVLSALSGRIASDLSLSDEVSTFSGVRSDVDLIETYVPIRGFDESVTGAFEIYTDVTPLVAQIRRDTLYLLVGSGLILAMIYSLLVFIARHAYLTIVQQYVRIAEKNAALGKQIVERELVEYALKKTHEELEQRVEQRTLALTKEINERKQVQDRLKRLSQAVEQSPAMTLMTDRSGNITYINRRFTEVTGYSTDEMIGQSPRILKSGKNAPSVYTQLWGAIETGGEWHGELCNRKKNGTLYWANVSISPIVDDSGEITHFLGTSEDITHRKATENQLRQQQAELTHIGRVSAIGEMASSLAHELNQPLTVISGSTQFCLAALRDGKFDQVKLVESLEQATQQTERANKIISRVRNFIQKRENKRTDMDINAVILEVMVLLEANAREYDSTIDLRLAPELRAVRVDAIQIQQVVVNLVSNALEATSKLPPAERVVVVETIAENRHAVCVSVNNSGPVISPEEMERVFDSFFTTRAEGLGMGLSISRSIVEAHGGRLWATSDPSLGTSFKFTLPLTGSSHNGNT